MFVSAFASLLALTSLISNSSTTSNISFYALTRYNYTDIEREDDSTFVDSKHADTYQGTFLTFYDLTLEDYYLDYTPSTQHYDYYCAKYQIYADLFRNPSVAGVPCAFFEFWFTDSNDSSGYLTFHYRCGTIGSNYNQFNLKMVNMFTLRGGVTTIPINYEIDFSKSATNYYEKTLTTQAYTIYGLSDYTIDLTIGFSPIDETEYNTTIIPQGNYEEGYSDGYQDGYDEGFTDAGNMDETASVIFTGILSIALVPVNFFLGILNFEVFGINVGALVSSLLTCLIIVIIVRMFFGGGGKSE